MQRASHPQIPGLPGAFLVTLGVTIGLAWVAMWQSGPSPFAHDLHAAHIPGSSTAPLPAATFIAGWTVMTIGMMLPTSLPLVALFAKVAGARPNRTWLTALVCLGYLSVWTAVGGLAYALTVAVRESVTRVAWLSANPWAIGSAAFIVAGAFQFSRIKYACLDRCRSTFGFISEHWSGRSEHRDAFRLGVHHGVFCVGCCWALMLLMIPLGAGHFGWMLVLGAVMAVEKNVSWGRAIVRPLGVALVLAGLATALGYRPS